MITSDDFLIVLNGVGKNFSTHLKTSMWYGLLDFFKTALGIRVKRTGLRDKEFTVLHDFSFELKKGDILGILGVNGAGKTTLLRLISGIYTPDSGEIYVNGKVVSLYAATLGMHPMFTGRENVYVRAAMYGMSKDETDSRMDDIIAYAELENFIDSPLGIYSSGMRARLGFAIAVHANADIIIIDEGLAVGDVAFRSKAFTTLKQLSENAAVLIVSHSINQIAQMANKIMVMDKGVMLFETTEVQKGIDYYISNCIQSPADAESATHVPIIQSSGIYSNQVTPDADDILRIQHGDSLSIEILLNPEIDVTNCFAEIEIVNSSKRAVAVIHSDTADFLLPSTINGPILIDIPKIELTSDKYFLHLSIRNRLDNKPVAIARFLHPFVVKSNVYSKESVQLSARWTVKA